MNVNKRLGLAQVGIECGVLGVQMVGENCAAGDAHSDDALRDTEIDIEDLMMPA